LEHTLSNIDQNTTSPACLDLGTLVRIMLEDEWPRLIEQRPIALYATFATCTMSYAHAQFVRAAVGELIRNAAFHAFPRNRSGRVGVHVWTANGHRPGTFAMVCDDGRGFELEHNSRGGLARAARLIEAASGELIHERGPGTIWRIVLP